MQAGDLGISVVKTGINTAVKGMKGG